MNRARKRQVGNVHVDQGAMAGQGRCHHATMPAAKSMDGFGKELATLLSGNEMGVWGQERGACFPQPPGRPVGDEWGDSRGGAIDPIGLRGAAGSRVKGRGQRASSFAGVGSREGLRPNLSELWQVCNLYEKFRTCLVSTFLRPHPGK